MLGQKDGELEASLGYIAKPCLEVGEGRREGLGKKTIIIGDGLTRSPIAMKRRQCHSNSYKGKHLPETGFQFQRFRSQSSCLEARHHAGGHGARERAESSTSAAGGEREPLGQT